MKRVYTDSYISRKSRALPPWARKLAGSAWKKVFIALGVIVLAVMMVSCLLAASEARVWPAVAESVKEIPGPAGERAEAPGVWASSAILMDAESGRVLYEKSAHASVPMASTTKMMTALVVVEQLDLTEKVAISAQAAEVGEQEIWLEPGETLTAEQLLWAMMVQSANDAAFALAEHTTGSIDSFAALMNKKAGEIGALESHFTNPHGLDQEGHYSSAYDLAIIGREVLKNPLLAKMVAARSYEIPWPGHPTRVCISHNEILDRYASANGIKTGYTLGAGWCLVASATRDGKTLIAVSLNSEHRADDVECLFNYGFSNTERVVLAKKDEGLGKTRVSAYPRRWSEDVPEKEIAVLSFKGSGDVFEVKTSVFREAPGSVRKGEKLGKIECLLNDSPLCSGNIVAAADVPKPGWLSGVIAFIWYSMCWVGRIFSAPFRIF